MKIPVLILPVVTGALLSSIYLLPQAGEMAVSAIHLELPQETAGWVLQSKPASEEEIKALASDTEFAKATCLRSRYSEYDSQSGKPIPDRIDLSVVLSGSDLNNSIHRPERCMPAQGHVINSSSTVILDLPNGHKLPLRRLLSVQSLPTNEERTEYVRYSCVTYYFFVGNDTITPDHLERAMIDMKDRLIHGMDQRWAYVSASMWYGELPWIKSAVSIQEADVKLSQFINDFAMDQINWSQIK
jgi:hypothetical protein